MRKNVERFRHEYAEAPDPVLGVADSPDMTSFESQTFNSYEYEGVVGESRRILGRIHEAVDERAKQSDGAFPRTVVLGVEDYLAVDAWIRHDSEGSSTIEDAVAVDILTIPGRMIHVPKTNERALIDHLKRQSD
jgi:hypothetical protein